MQKSKGVNTGVYVSPIHMERWNTLAANLGISRNAVLGLLLESAEVTERPRIETKLSKNRNDNGAVVAAESVLDGLPM